MTKKISILLFLAALFCSGQALSQIKTEGEEKPYIELNGKADQEVIPNEIFISIIIRERYTNKEKQTIEVQEEKLKAALKEINIDLSNLALSDANADYVKVKLRTKDVLTKKDYTLKVTNATVVGQVFQQLDKIDITDAFISRVSHTKLDSLRKEVRIAAIKSAKAKADYLLSAIGEQTGKTLVVREVEFEPHKVQRINGIYSNNRLMDYDKNKESNEEQEIQFKKIKVECTIYVKFAIK